MSAKKSLVVAALLGLGAAHCNLNPFPPVPAGGGPLPAATGGAAGGATEIPLSLQPESAWTANFGPIHPVCAGGENPRETAFTTVGEGVSMSSASDRVDCCTCVARSRSIAVSRSSTRGAHLRGTAIFTRGRSDTWSQASVRVTLKDGASAVGSRVIAGEDRADNCSMPSELPALLADPSGAFDVDLEALAPGASFDTIAIDLDGYACGDASNSVTLEEMRLAFGGAPATVPVPPASATAPPPPSSTPPSPTGGVPDLATSLSPGAWRSYATGPIGMDNSGSAHVSNHGTATAKGVSVEIHTESNNSYGPVAPFRKMDPRCAASTSYANAYTCTIGDLAAGASVSLDFVFNSFSDTAVVAVATAKNGDADFADNRAVGHVYAE
jgi:hypothetical protein